LTSILALSRFNQTQLNIAINFIIPDIGLWKFKGCQSGA
jgi:hypothetical protein